MAIAPTLISIAEINVTAVLASAGSNTKNVASVFHYRRTSTSSALSKTALNTAFVAGPFTAMLAALNARYGSAVAKIRWLDDALDAYQFFTLIGSGAIATDSLPSYNAVFMLMRTGVRGKSYKGSKHFPGVSEADTTGDVLTGSGLTRWQAVQAAVAASLTDGNGNVWNPTIVSRKLSQLTVNPTTVVANDVTSVVLDIDVGTMRRRKVQTAR